MARGAEITGRQGKPEMILTGPVLSVSPTTGFFVMRQGTGKDAEEIPVEVDAKTSLMRGGRKVNIDEVKTGERVKVSYSGSAGDVMKTVEVMGGPASKSVRSGKSTKAKRM
jgi:hypothetical protein